MREIKFRGKDIETDEWRYGSLIIERNRAYILCGKLYFLDDISGQFSGVYEIKPETVGQYTGLKDKNGKEIYEGDIVGTPYNVGLVFMRLGCWFVENQKELGYFPQYEIEVIGNIYENPELLEEG